ncbi:MAG: nucleotidyltransferase family protein [Gammaproteobacteria bacterium]|nr:MAG: nucleotidyltransferase family protein [Gammaproteobacteria bacterium]
MLLAAGRGERMRPLSDTRPKPLLEAGGRPLIEYPLRALAAAGVRRAVINTAWLGAQLRERLGDGREFGLEIVYSREPPAALDTGGGIRQALPLLGPDPFWLVNGDVYSEFDFPAWQLPAAAVAKLLLVPNPPHHPRGDFCLQGQRVTLDTGERLTYAGIALLRPQLLARERPGRFALAPVLRAAIARGLVRGERFDACWSDVGTPARLRELDRHLKAARRSSRR